MGFSKISRIGRGVEAPLSQEQLELIQVDLDQVFLLLSNGITSEYISSGSIDSVYLTTMIKPETVQLVGKMTGPT
tara:strand:+ start:3893 stop:4117 length:225 start_codon:yes stop_codon:yes gene_type:complete